MRKNISRLMMLNLLAYINSFVFSIFFTCLKDKLLSEWFIFGIWSLTPYVFIIITSFILVAYNKKGNKIIKKYAIADWIVRFISMCVVFQEWNFKFLSFEFVIEQIIILILFFINITLEIIMNKKLKSYPSIEKSKDPIEKISEEEKFRIRTIIKASAKGMRSFILFSIAAGAYYSIMSSPKNIFYQLFVMIAWFVVFLWFIRENIEKCNLFYLDKKLADRVSKKDSFYALAGFFIFTFGVLLIPQSYFPLSTLPLLAQIMLLYPMIKTTRSMSIRVKKVSKVLRDSDTFSLYYNYKD